MMDFFSSLRCKEVICVTDGSRLGYVCDLELDTCCGKILSIMVPGKARLFGLLGREDDYVIPWNCIRRIGEDIILVDAALNAVRRTRAKKW